MNFDRALPSSDANASVTAWLCQHQIAILADLAIAATKSHPPRLSALINRDIAGSMHDATVLEALCQEAMDRLSSGDKAGALAWGRVAYVAHRRASHAWLAFLHIAIEAGELQQLELTEPKIIASSENDSCIIPRDIIQYWDATDPPEDVGILINSWRDIVGYSHILIDDIEAKEFLKISFDQSVCDAYELAPHVASRADLLRLAWLARYGGVYSDADERLVGDLNQLIPPDAGLVMNWSGSDVPCINNWFFAVRPNHPLIRGQLNLAVARLHRASARKSPHNAWLTTGPGVTSMCVLDAVCAADLGKDSLADVRLHTEATFRQIVLNGESLQYRNDPARNWRLAV